VGGGLGAGKEETEEVEPHEENSCGAWQTPHPR